MELLKSLHIFSFILYYVILLNLNFIVNSEASHICSGIDEELSKDRLATRTSYFAAYKDDSFLNQYKNEVSSCAVKKLWFLTRHGTRYPIKSDFGILPLLVKIKEDVVDNHHQGRGCLDEDAVRKLDVWFPPYSSRDEGQLQEVAYEELFSIGEHWKNMFPEIFNSPYNPTDYKVEFTIKNRTGQSAYHFLRGVFGDDAVGRIELPKPYTPNFLLRFYKSCPRWMRDVYKNNATTYKERLLFEEGEEFQSVIHAISARLGYMHPLEISEVKSIYDECRYESAWWPDYSSPWCESFSKRDIEILEYWEDLKYYYEDSYGNELNGQIACRTLSDLYTRFKETVLTGISEPRALLYFSHDKALLKVLTALGLFKPTVDLKHNSFEEMKDRPFRTSVIAPFTNNIAFGLFKCDEKFQVATFFQGLPIPLKSVCKSTILCPWEKVSKYLKPIHSTCDLSKLCMLHDEL